MFGSEQTGHHEDDSRQEQEEREPRRECQTETHAAHFVLLLHDLECLALCFLDALSERALVVVRLEEDGAKCGRKGECIQGGEGNGNGHCDTKLAIEDTTCAAEEGNGDEHRHHDEGDREDGPTEFAHRIERGFARRGVTHVKFGMHTFHHDDGVVDHDGNGQNEG